MLQIIAPIFGTLKGGCLAELQPQGSRILANIILYCKEVFFFFNERQEEVNEGETPCGNRSKQLLPRVLSTGVPNGVPCLIACFKALRHHGRLHCVCVCVCVTCKWCCNVKRTPKLSSSMKAWRGGIHCEWWKASATKFLVYTFKALGLLCVAPGLTFNNSTFCPHTVFMCFVWI